MKKLIVIFFLAGVLFAQNDNAQKLSFKVTIEGKGSSATSTGIQDERGFMKGLLFGKEGYLHGTSPDQDFCFLTSLSEVYWKYKDNPVTSISDEERAGLYNKNTYTLIPGDGFDNIIQFSFYPVNYTAGNKNIVLYCKYIIYTKVKSNGAFTYNYDISFYEKFINVVLDKPFEPDFIKNIFSNEKVEAVFSIDKEINSAGEKNYNINSVFNCSYLGDDINAVIESINNSKIKNENLQLGIEYVRTDKTGNDILIRKLDYPLKSTYLFLSEGKLTNLKNMVYIGSISVPLIIYNKEKQDLFEKSKYRNELLNYNVSVVPIDKNKNIYSFDVYVMMQERKGISTSKTRIDLERGKKYKLDIDLFNSIFDTEVEGKHLTINTAQDVHKYINESIVIDFE